MLPRWMPIDVQSMLQALDQTVAQTVLKAGDFWGGGAAPCPNPLPAVRQNLIKLYMITIIYQHLPTGLRNGGLLGP